MITGYENKLSKRALEKIEVTKNRVVITEILKQLTNENKKCTKLKLFNINEVEKLFLYCNTYDECKIIFETYVDNVQKLENILNK